MDSNDFRNSPYNFTIKRPVLATLIVVTIVVFGLLSLKLLPVNMMPEISYPSITVRTEYPGAAPEEVEQIVTYPLEQSLGVLRDLVEISSSSRAGFSDIQLEFAWNTDMNRATQEVREKLDLVFLPEEIASPLILRYDPTLDPLMRIGLTSDSLEPRDLRDLAERVVKIELEKLNGVAAVKIRGGEEAEIRVQVNEAALDLLNLTLDKIEARIAAENVNVAGGRLQDGQAEYILRTVSEFKNIEEIGSIAIDVRNSEIIRLRDISKVSLASKEVTTLTRSRGKLSVELELFRESDANPVAVSDLVRKRIFGGDEQQRIDSKKDDSSKGMGLQRGPLPLSKVLTGNIPIEILSDQAEFLRQAIDEVISAAIIGGLLAILVLFLFLGSVLDTLIVAMVIPVSLVSAFAAMNYWHITLNVMSLGGLALGIGMMVDNSIVVIESIYQRREAGDSSAKSAVIGTRIVGGAVISSTLTTVVVFFPVVFVTGVAGQIFSDLSMTVIIALLASLLIALFYVPMLVVRLRHSGAIGQAESELTNPRVWFKGVKESLKSGISWYKSRSSSQRIFLAPVWLPYIMIRLIFGFTAAIIGLGVAYIVSGLLWIFRRTTGKFLRNLKRLAERGLASFDALFRSIASRYAGFLDRKLKKPLPILLTTVALTAIIVVFLLPGLGSELIPEISQGTFEAHFSLPIGTTLERTDVVIREIEEITKTLPEVISVSSRIGSDPTDANTVEEGTHTGRMTVQLKRGGNLPKRESEVIESIRKFVSETPSLKMVVTHPTLFTFKQPIELIIKGDDLEQLKTAAVAVESACSSISSLSDIESSVKPGHPELSIQFNRERLALLNLSQRTIAERIKSSVLGDIASKFRQVERHIDIRVNLAEGNKKNVEEISALVVNPDESIPVKLSDIAKLQVFEGSAEIRHTDGVRSAILTASITGLDLGKVTQELDLVVSSLRLPPDVTVELGGQHREMEASLKSLYWALLLAIFLVYVVMASQFESFGHPFLILFTIPFAVIGVIPILWLMNIPLSVMVFLGLIILVGIVVNNSIVLIDYSNQLRQGGMSLHESLVSSARSRLRPILMTTLTTILGLLPMAVGLGEGAEMRRPMAITVMVGLLLGTIVTLIIIPLIYSLVMPTRKKHE